MSMCLVSIVSDYVICYLKNRSVFYSANVHYIFRVPLLKKGRFDLMVKDWFFSAQRESEVGEKGGKCDGTCVKDSCGPPNI